MRHQRIALISCCEKQPHEGRRQMLLNIVDDAGGIRRDLLPKLGQLFLTGDPE
jgi:hypothetical protein